ncbi:hypothetical protein LSG25_13245 [Paralcaligenes sp. KSB-10]|uniref:hypothetical protein n=1 Tax=Paralcaligenes sp. KSB-10 TaxID=2901142 RepID=UPI001E3D2071|nr:hypothetical protein [Paralcaligenes sp. KSB-10]UHL63033.1 hypothetical protein LSG25_13245 [Paralcaligenes sp. KSB-10]
MNPPIISRSGRFDAMTYVPADAAADEGLAGISYRWSFSSNEDSIKRFRDAGVWGSSI